MAQISFQRSFRIVTMSAALLSGFAAFLLMAPKASARSTFYAWDSYGDCNEYAPNGAVVSSHVPVSFCRASQGSFYSWDSYGDCNEYASNGAVVTSHVPVSF